MTETFVLDAWAILAYLNKESPADTRVVEILEQARQSKVHAFISIINLGEVYYCVGRIHGETSANRVLEKLFLLPIEVLSVDNDMVLAAARLKMTYAISYADAFAVVTSQQRDAVLLTGDPELVKLERVLQIEKLIR